MQCLWHYCEAVIADKCASIKYLANAVNTKNISSLLSVFFNEQKSNRKKEKPFPCYHGGAAVFAIVVLFFLFHFGIT